MLFHANIDTCVSNRQKMLFFWVEEPVDQIDSESTELCLC